MRDGQPICSEEVPHGQPTLDEITNKVFEELLVGKSTNKYDYSEGSCKVSLYNFILNLVL